MVCLNPPCSKVYWVHAGHLLLECFTVFDAVKGKPCTVLVCFVILWLSEHQHYQSWILFLLGSLTDAFNVLSCTLDKSSVRQKCIRRVVVFPLQRCIASAFIKLSYWLPYPFRRPPLLVLFSPTTLKIQGKLWLSVSRFLSRERSCFGDTKCKTKITFSSSNTNMHVRMMH